MAPILKGSVRTLGRGMSLAWHFAQMCLKKYASPNVKVTYSSGLFHFLQGSVALPGDGGSFTGLGTLIRAGLLLLDWSFSDSVSGIGKQTVDGPSNCRWCTIPLRGPCL